MDDSSHESPVVNPDGITAAIVAQFPERQVLPDTHPPQSDPAVVVWIGCAETRPPLLLRASRTGQRTALTASGIYLLILLVTFIVAMALNRYRHVTPDMQRSAADTLDAAFTMVL